MPRRLLCAGILSVLTSVVLPPLLVLAGEAPSLKGSANEPKAAVRGKVLVNDVVIQGNTRMTAEQIKARLRTQVGHEYDSATMDADVRDLYKTQQYSNIRTLVQESGPGKVKIFFLLRSQSSVVQTVTFRGAKHIKVEELHRLTGVHPGMHLNPNLNRQGCQRIIERYEEQGRASSQCDLVKGGGPDDTEVIYEIVEGPKVKVADIRFTGNTFISTARLVEKLRSSSGWFHIVGGKYVARVAESDLQEVVKYFHSVGFDDVKVTLETQRSVDGCEVTMIVHIQEGPRYCGDEHKQAKPAAPEKKTTEQSSARVGQIFIIGNETVSQTSILAHVPLFPGQVLKYSDLKEAEKNLARLGMFVVDPAKGIHPTIEVLDAEGDGPFKDIRITVKEKPRAKDPKSKP